MNAITKNRLHEIAETVKTEHAKIEGALREGLTRAVEVGKLLTEAKGLVKHGDWLKWVTANCQFSERTAQNYMRLSDRLPELKSAAVADLTYREAVGLLAEPKPIQIANLQSEKWTDRLESLHDEFERLIKLREFTESDRPTDYTLSPARRILETAKILTACEEYEEGVNKYLTDMRAVMLEATQDEIFPLLPVDLQQKAIDWVEAVN